VAASSFGQPPADYVPGEVIIKFKSPVPSGEIAAVKASLGAVVLNRFDSIRAEHWKVQNMSVQAAIDYYKNDPRVEYIEPNYIYTADQIYPNDPRFPDLWGLNNTGQTGGIPDADIDAPEGWVFETGDEVLCGVIDTGTDWHHVDLADNIYINPGEIPDNGVDDDGNGFVDDVHGWDFVNNDNDPFDDAGHGTHVSGTIGAVSNNGIGVVGVSWTVKILPIKFLDQFGNGTTTGAIRSVEYANLMGVDLTNNSWGGGGYSQALRDAIEHAGDLGMLFVAAAGNGSSDTDVFPHYPSSYDLDNIISVANTNHSDLLSGTSNWGLTSVDLGAPGSNILSTTPNNNYGYSSGTSMASPHVAGAVSLLWSAAPAMTHLDVKYMIMGAVDPIPALEGRTVTGGRLNIFNFLSQLDSIPPAKVTDLAVESTSSNTAILTWTASGDDGADGTAARYDIRYSQSQIYWSNFDQAMPVPNPPTPLPSGSPETFEVWGLDFNTSYSFAMKVYDEQDNVSWISNLPQMATTLGIPRMVYAPASFTDNLETGGTSTQILTIENVGEGTLDFSFSTLPWWLSADPASGRVEAGLSAQVEVVFDATGLPGGVHSGNITMHSNDPAQTTVVVPVTLNVTGAPDIAVAPESLDFGPVYIGLTTSLPLIVTNIGAIPLVVSGVSTDNAEFGVDPSGFVLPPSASRIVTVDYTPATEGPVAGTLTIDSDDPDHPQLDVGLAGEGVDPPVILVSPGSLGDSLYTGARSSHLLTISNNGGSDLQFDITTEETDLTAAVAVESRLNIPRSDGDYPRGTDPPSIGMAPRNGVRTASPSSVPILTGGDGSSFSTEAQNGVFVSFDLNVPQVLNTVAPAPQFIWLGDFGPGDNSFVYALNDLNQFMQIDTTTGVQTNLGTVTPWAGESFTGMATDPTNGTMYLSSTDISASSLYLLDPINVTATRIGSIGSPGVIAIAVDDQGDMYGHDIVNDVLLSIDKTTATGTMIGSLGFDANYAQGMAFDPVSGELLLAAFNSATFEAQLRVADRTTGATVLLGVLGSTTPGGTVQLGWLGIPGGGVPWLTADPTTGTVPPGTSMDVTVTFDAGGLLGGDYIADVVVATPDPINSDVIVPAFLHVTGAPDIAVSDTVLTFGQVFIGGTETQTLVVSNAGTDLLSVSNVGTSHSDYSVNFTSFDLNPGQSRDVEVMFAPTTAAVIPATMTIESNDPDESALPVDLLGEGLDPPIISVNPSSLSDSLYTGEESSHLLTVSNAGYSDLQFEIIPRESGTTAGFDVQTRLNIPRSSGDFPRGTNPPSIGVAPQNGVPTAPPSTAPVISSGNGSSFATDASNSQFVSFDLAAPEVLNSVATAPQFIWLGDFGPGDNAFVYALNDLNQFTQIDTATGAQTVLGTVTPWGGEDFSGMATDPTNGTMYLSSTDVSASSLYLLDPETVTATRIGPIGLPGIIAIAADDMGDMYGHDIVTDELVAIDKTTGAGTVIGSLGFDANFAQGMAFDPVSGELLLAAFNSATFEAQLRVADRTTGATALLGVLGGTVPGGTVQLGWMGIPGGGLRWLSADPVTGTVPPGMSMDVTVTFDAGGLFGGEYNADLVVANNDPITPEFIVPAHLFVTGAPDIAMSDTSLDYGQVFIGATPIDTLVVYNFGTDLLTVYDIVSDHSDYSVDVANFAVDPGQSQIVRVSFAPTTASVIPGTLTVSSNDPDQPAVVVQLLGEGLVAPVISVSPESVSDDLLTGQISTHSLTIDNTGGSDLAFGIDIHDAPGAVVSVSAVPRRNPGENPRVVSASTRPKQTDAASGSLAPEESAGQLFDVGGTVPPSALDILFEDDFEDGNFDGWLDGGGSGNREVTDETAANGTRYSYHESNSSGSHFQGVYQELGPIQPGYVGFYIRSGSNTSNDAYVVLTSSVGEGLIWFFARASGLLYCNGNLEGGDETVPYVANQWYHIEYKNIDFTSNTFDYYVDEVLVKLAIPFRSTAPSTDLYRADLYSYDSGAQSWWDEIFVSTGEEPQSWISANPTTGTVPAGTSVDVEITFDATGLFGGAYDAELLVVNNDPLNPVVTVPAHLDVTGVPRVAVSDSALNYGPVFVGYSATTTLVVTNVGTDLLTVSDISSDLADYTADVSSFGLAPGASQDVLVAFSPASEGGRMGTLTVTSDDPVDPAVSVTLVGEGLVPPVFAVSPDSLSEHLFAGGTSTQMLTIDNSGGSTLLYSVALEDLGKAGATAAASVSVARGDLARDMEDRRQTAPAGMAGNEVGNVQLIEIEKGEEDPRTYPEMILGAGGPDPFGYGWKDSNDPDGPVFSWIDASGGLPIPLSDDSFQTGIPLGFTFNYYGIDYTEIGVGSNGWMSFNGDDRWYPGTVPAVDPYIGAIAPFAYDLYPPGANYVTVRTFGAAPGRYCVVEYNNIPDYPGGNNKTFEVVFYEGSNKIRFQYLNAPNTPNGFGIESPDQTMGMGNGGSGDLFISPLVVGDAYAIEFSLLPDWIAVDPTEGTVPAGESRTVAVTFDAAGLLGGDYYANILIANNDPSNPLVTVPAHLDVTGAADIAVSDTLLDFGTHFIGTLAVQTISVSNAGTDDLIVSDITSDLPDYTVDIANFTLPVGMTQQVELSFVPVAAGSRNGTLTISSNDPDEPAFEVAMLGEGLELPGIAVHPDSLADDLYSGDMSLHTLTISNPGGSDLVFAIQTTETTAAAADPPAASIGPGADESPAFVSWLDVSQVNGTVPAGGNLDVSVTFDATNLVGGNYSADIEISTNIPGEPSVVVPATLDVTGAPNIAVSDTLLDFESVYLGYPESKNFLVSNNGTDVLTVSDITADQPVFTASPASFQLPIGGNQVVEVSYDPTEVGATSALLTVSSDDPDEPSVTIALEAEALDPPVIAISVDSIAVVVPVGDTVVETFTIDNTGGSDLTWNVEPGLRVDAPFMFADMGSAATINVLWYGDHGLGDIALWSTIIADIAARGAVVTQTFGPITPELLSDAKIIWFGNDETALTQAEKDAVIAWVNDGGGLLFEADSDASITNHSLLLAALGSGLNYSILDGFSGITNSILPHVTTAGVNELFLLSPGARVRATGPPGGLLFTDRFGQPMGAFSEVGTGRIVALSDHLFHDVAVTQSDNRLFANQVFSWLALGGFDWLSVTPQTGTLAAGNSVEISLELDASILPSGAYDLNLEVMSNDPGMPVVTIRMHVVVDSTVTITGVGDGQVPGTYQLHPNYPNPFNPTTTIRYDLPAAQDVKIVIYNVRGERVRVLVDRHQAPGRHEAAWDGRNSRGESVASGVYLYRIVAGEFVRTRKMTLLK
jgi:subtilisin family serine protease